MTYTVYIENKYFYAAVAVEAETDTEALAKAKAQPRPEGLAGRVRYSLIHPTEGGN